MFDPEEGLAILAECSVVGVGSGNLGSGGAGILGLGPGRTQLVLGQSAPPLTQSYLVNSPRPLAKAPFANECVITGDQVPRLGRRPSTKRARHNAGLEARPSIRPCLYFDLGGRFIVPGGERSRITCWRTLDRSKPRPTSIWAPTPSPSRRMPRSMCSVPMLWWPSCRASRSDSSSTFFARGVKGGEPD